MLPQRHNKSMQDKNYILEGHTKSQKPTSSTLAFPFYFLFLILSPASPSLSFKLLFSDTLKLSIDLYSLQKYEKHIGS